MKQQTNALNVSRIQQNATDQINGQMKKQESLQKMCEKQEEEVIDLTTIEEIQEERNIRLYTAQEAMDILRELENDDRDRDYSHEFDDDYDDGDSGRHSCTRYHEDCMYNCKDNCQGKLHFEYFGSGQYSFITRIMTRSIF